MTMGYMLWMQGTFTPKLCCRRRYITLHDIVSYLYLRVSLSYSKTLISGVNALN